MGTCKDKESMIIEAMVSGEVKTASGQSDYISADRDIHSAPSCVDRSGRVGSEIPCEVGRTPRHRARRLPLFTLADSDRARLPDRSDRSARPS